MLKYQQIAKQIFSYIQDSQLKQGDQLPSLTELVTDYQASKITIQKAIAELEKKALSTKYKVVVPLFVACLLMITSISI